MIKVGNQVDMKENNYPVYGKVISIKGKNAEVCFKTPKDPKGDLCESCGWPGFLSINGCTGEVVCMRSGCGHEHGFTKRIEIIPLSKLINISTKQQKEERQELLSKINLTLTDAIMDEIITREEKLEILQTLKKII